MSTDAEYVIGIDEVGLGAWAGPMVIAGIAMPKGWGHKEVKDSKRFTSTKKTSAHERRKKVLHSVIKPAAKFEIVRVAGAALIDEKGVSQVLDETLAAVARSCHSFCPSSIVVIDGSREPYLDFLSRERLIVMPKADTIIPVVAAASIAAKVARDSIMIGLHEKYPQYGFDRHVGYGTKEHSEAIKQYGLCLEHRTSYKPIQDAMKQHRPLKQRPFTVLGVDRAK
jgi:ribonuclease HII